MGLRHEPPFRRPYYLSAALPAGLDKIGRLEASQIAVPLDWMNLMSYDYHGGWENRTHHHAPLFSGDGLSASASVDAYLEAGLPASKLLLGIPAYGRAWKNVPSTAFGLAQAAAGLPQGTYEVGVFDYKDLIQKIRLSPLVWVRHWDPVAQASWLYAPSLENGLMVSYEDRQSLQAKLRYLRDKGMAGAMLWDLSSDLLDPEDPDSLLGNLRRGTP